MPSGRREPLAYVDFLTRIVAERAIEAVLPTHEQAWLLAAARRRLPDDLPLAVARPDAFNTVNFGPALTSSVPPKGRAAKLGPLLIKYKGSLAHFGCISTTTVGMR